ncbi:MAG: isopeptide-forming domain-containing fimbrial protein, partial [Acidobacteriota bacterium]|nr:isopeptide-forming domain-containing fimbrial protein [Acidobacteriota bacterium]
MLNDFFSRTFIIILLCVILAGHMAGLVAFAAEAGSAGTVISNRAEATYRNDEGTDYTAVSETVTVTILSVSSLVVTPDETQSSASVGPYERITRLFRVCNTGNTPDRYTITQADVNSPAGLINLYFDNDGTGTVTNADTLVNVNGSPSPDVLPGGCIGVLAVVDTNDSPANTDLIIRLTARSSALGSVNGSLQDQGTIINAVGAAARLAAPADSNLPPLKTVNGSSQAVVSAGTPFTYTIAFRNYGDTAARSVVCIDDLPTELEYVPFSLSLDGRNLSDAVDADEGYVQGHRVVVQLNQVAPNQLVTISFQARLNGSVAGGVGLTNFATLTGENVALVISSKAIVVIDPFGTVFAGRAGSAAPIAGAQVQIVLNQDGSNALSIPPGIGFSPNLENVNPFISDGQGHFSFALPPEQLGSELSPARYFMKVTAQAYSARMLEITLQPKQTGLFTLTIRALDGQPLARAGGFDLVRENVRIEDLAAVVLNIPMFEPYGLEISKSADRPRAEIGDAIAYSVQIHNPTAAPVSDLIVRDRLPTSFHYVPGTGRLSRGSTEEPIEPEIAGDEIVFHLGEIGPGESARLLYRARVGANAHEGQQENIAVAAGMFPNGALEQTQP